MVVQINGEETTIPEGLSVTGLLEHLKLTEGPVAVEQNRKVVPRAAHPSTPVKEGDELEIVHFVGGG